MFTGLVEEIGVVSNVDVQPGGSNLTVSLPASSSLLADCQDGDSIAVNGVCLTVTSFTTVPTPSFTLGVAPETLRVTNLGSLVAESRVNLERAVRADTRMGGHFVQGHVDTVAEILQIQQDGSALTFRFRPRDQALMRYIVFKGFIALDGTSLTITKVNDDEGWFEVMLIVYTQERVVLAQKKAGETVNVEVDVLAKYAEKSMAGYLGAQLEGKGDGSAMGILEKVVQGIMEKTQKK